MNVHLVRAFWFLQQFCPLVRHKPGKEHIIPDALSRLASANFPGYNKVYSELDALFTYYATLMEISPNLIKRIFNGYPAQNWWVKVPKQLLTNDNLGRDKAILLFIFGSTKPPSSADSYFIAQPKPQNQASNLSASKHASDFPALGPARPSGTGGAQLIYHVDRVTGMHRLYIRSVMALDLPAITNGGGHPSFACCHEIILRSWYI